MGTRRFLLSTHPFKNQISQFNVNKEHRKHPKRLSGFEVLSRMETIETKIGKVGKKRKWGAEERDSTAWSKRSIFFNLSYWKVRALFKVLLYTRITY